MEDLGVVTLVRATWFLSTLPIVAAWLQLPGLGWLRKALKRGKILQSNTKLTVPQRFFSHFYVVALLWTTILLVAVWFYAIEMLPSLIDKNISSTVTSNLHKSMSAREHAHNVWLSVFLLLLMETHILRPFYESFYIFNYSPLARMHIGLYLGGIIYYIGAPLSLCCTIASGVFKFVKNPMAEFILKERDGRSSPEFNIWMFVTPFLSLRWYAWIGACIFFWGWLHQLRCHKILGSLRKKSETLGVYVIPYGDWFEYVSSPHYTAEIVIYGGLLVASGGTDLSLWLLLALVVANLGFAASITHKWYMQKFDEYPRNRCAIFPFVY